MGSGEWGTLSGEIDIADMLEFLRSFYIRVGEAHPT